MNTLEYECSKKKATVEHMALTAGELISYKDYPLIWRYVSLYNSFTTSLQNDW